MVVICEIYYVREMTMGRLHHPEAELEHFTNTFVPTLTKIFFFNEGMFSFQNNPKITYRILPRSILAKDPFTQRVSTLIVPPFAPASCEWRRYLEQPG